MRTIEEMTTTDSTSQGDAQMIARRNRTIACVLAFAIGTFLQLSMPLTDLYQIPNVRGVFFTFIVAVFVFRFLTGEPIRTSSFFMVPYMALSIFLAVGILYSRAPEYGTTKVILVASYFLALGMVLYNLVDDMSVGKAFLNGLVLGGVLLVGISAVEFGNPIEVIRGANRYFRLRFGEEGNPIMLARHLALAITMIATYVLVRRRWIDLMWSIPICIITCAYLVATGSKGPILALLVSFVCAPILLVKGVVARLSVTVLVVGLFLIATIAILEVAPKTFMEERVSEKIENLSLRLPAYRQAIDAILTSDPIALVIGHGTGDFGYLALGKDGRAYPHNVLLEVAYENGIVGLALISVAFVFPLIAAMRSAQQRLGFSQRALLAGLAASYIASVVNAQFSGDLGANLFIGMFGAATVSIARLGVQNGSDA